MQQAYRMLRVVAEAQTIRMVLMLAPNSLLLAELCSACTTLTAENTSGIKAIVLDFTAATYAGSTPDTEQQEPDKGTLHETIQAIHALPPPVLAVVRDSVTASASALIQATDLTLVAHHAALLLSKRDSHTREELSGVEALRLGLVSWSVPSKELDTELERILSMLRNKSAVALRLTKESTRLGPTSIATGQGDGAKTPLDALKQINEFYLTHVMQTADAAEGLHAFLEKRQPHWENC